MVGGTSPTFDFAAISGSTRTATGERMNIFTPVWRRRMMPRKTCPRCGVDKLETEFYASALATRIKTAVFCKTCYKARAAAYRQAKKNAKRGDAPATALAPVVADEANVENSPRSYPAERGLSDRRIQEHAEWYSGRAYWHYSPAAIAAGALDAELRAILSREVGPERVEVEFARVTKVIPWSSSNVR
jgi:hypothetical protein